MSDSDDVVGVEVAYELINRQGKVRLTLGVPGGDELVDQLTITSEGSRSKFTKKICDRYPGIEPEALQAELGRIAAAVAGHESEGGGSVADSQADMVMELMDSEDVDLFHAPGQHEAEGYATVVIGGHRETWPIESSGFSAWLRRRFYEKHKKVLRSQSVMDALGNIAARAVYDGSEMPVGMRVAEHDGAIYIDLCNDQWQVVKVTAEGWSIISSVDCPVRFVRRRGTLPQSIPEEGGDINDLRKHVNLSDDDQFVLYVSTLLAYLLPRGPFPILILGGEQGSAKSTACRRARALVDPNKAALRRPPRTDHDLMVAASNSRVVAFDNVSGIKPNLADSLCALATGTGFAARQLYTDSDEKIFDLASPVMVNGIGDISSRSDLLDRAVTLELPSIQQAMRRTESELDREFEAARPALFGALLDGVSAVLRNRGKVKLSSLPRMADFAVAATAAEETFGWASGTFMAAYTGNREESYRVAIEASPIGAPLLAMLRRCSQWQGTAQELLQQLTSTHGSASAKERPEWPKTPRAVRAELDRLAPSLRALGFEVDFTRAPGRNRDRIVRFTAPQQPEPGDSGADQPGRSGDGVGTVGEGHTVPGESRFSTPPGPVRDGWDGRDGAEPTFIPEDNTRVADQPAPASGNGACRPTDGAPDNTAHGVCDREQKVCSQPSRPSRPSRTSAGDPESGDRSAIRDGVLPDDGPEEFV